jgi:hypothetical protein
MREKLFVAVAAWTTLALGGAALAQGQSTQIRVTIENLAPQFGTYQTPFWVGFHNGTFDIYDLGSAASAAVESIAEDGNTAPLSAAFTLSGAGALEGVIPGSAPQFPPGDVSTMVFTLDGNNANSRYFSYASMVIPSNDAFVANDDAMAHMIFDGAGNFVGADFFITGAMVYDAGTEVNDEIPMNTAFFGQAAPNTGTDENGVVHLHPGFNGSFGNPGIQSILADPMFAGADFTLAGYPIARITITEVPAPGVLTLIGIAGCLARRRRRAHD